MADRKLRIASSARDEIAKMISTKEIKELAHLPSDTLISVTEVHVEKGYQHLRVDISVFDKNQIENIKNIFTKAEGQIRGELCRKLRLKIAPSISFYFDNSLEKGFKIEQLIQQINQEENTNNTETKEE